MHRRNLHLFQEGKRVGVLEFDVDDTTFISSPTLSDDVRQQIMNVYAGIPGSIAGLEAAKTKYRVSGYEAFEYDEITDPVLRYKLEKREATPFQKREATFINESNLIEDITEISYEQILYDLVNDISVGHVSAWRYAKTLSGYHLPLKSEDVCTMQKFFNG